MAGTGAQKFDLGQTLGDLVAVVRVLFEDGPAVRAAIVHGANDPVIVAGWNAGVDALGKVIQQLKIGSVAEPAPAAPAIPIQQVIQALQEHVGPTPEGPPNANI